MRLNEIDDRIRIKKVWDQYIIGQGYILFGKPTGRREDIRIGSYDTDRELNAAKDSLLNNDNDTYKYIGS